VRSREEQTELCKALSSGDNHLDRGGGTTSFSLSRTATQATEILSAFSGNAFRHYVIHLKTTRHAVVI
jgi:hypothetical protein